MSKCIRTSISNVGKPWSKCFSLVLDLLKVCLYVKLESSVLQDLLCKSDWLDRSKIVQIVFLQNFPTQPKHGLSCRVLCFALSIKGKTLATFRGSSLCYVCESFVKSRGGCLHIHLGFTISRLMSKAWWSIQLQILELKDIQAVVLVLAGNPRKK